MAPRARPNFKPQRRPIYLKAWRKHRGGMSQEKLVEKLVEMTGYETSPGQLSRIENGNQPYTQDLLEAAAVVLQCAPEDLIMRDPTREGAPHSILDGLSPKQLRRVERLAQVVREEDDDERTGTDG